MTGIEFYHNGTYLFTAAMGTKQSLTFLMHLKQDAEETSVFTRMGGMTESLASYEWNTPAIKSGDELTIKLVEVDADTLQTARQQEVPDQMIDQVKRMLDERNQASDE